MPQPDFLVSVNKTPARAALLVVEMLRSIGEENNITHIANTASVEGLALLLSELIHPPRFMICSSQWTAEEQEQARAIATQCVPHISIIDIPPGLDDREGGEGVIRFLKSALRSELQNRTGNGIPRQGKLGEA